MIRLSSDRGLPVFVENSVFATRSMVRVYLADCSHLPCGRRLRGLPIKAGCLEFGLKPKQGDLSEKGF